MKNISELTILLTLWWLWHVNLCSQRSVRYAHDKTKKCAHSARYIFGFFIPLCAAE